MPLDPSINDRDYDYWRKIAWNFYEIALDEGVSGLEPPSWNDPQATLIKKTAYYTATLA